MLMAGVKHLVIFLAIIFGVAATGWGLSQTPWPTVCGFLQDAWSAESLLTWNAWDYPVFYLAAAAIIVCVLSSWLKINRLVAGVVVALAIATFTGTIWPLIVTLWLGLASYALGSAILTLLKIHKEKLSDITAALMGACVYGSAVGLAAHFPVNYPGLYGLALAVPVVFGWRGIAVLIKSWKQYCSEKSVSPWHDLAIALVALTHFSVALMPELGHDALATHLFIPAHLATRHVWSYDVTTYVWAVMPMMGDWLYSTGYMLAGETAPRLINVGFIFALSWLTRDLVIWAGGSASGARWAVLLFLTTPLTFTESSSLFIESVWATLIVAGSLAVFRLVQQPQHSDDQTTHLKTAGLLLGAAAAAKAVTFTILPALLLLLALGYRSWCQRKLMSAVAVGLILFIIVGGIPYLTAWYLTGNPVFPFFNQLFKSPFWPAVAFDVSATFGKGLNWDVIYQTTFHTEKFLEGAPGAPGFQWILLFFPALLVLLIYRQSKGLILVAVAVLCIALTFQSITYLRYIFPSFVWAAAGIGVALSAVQTNGAFIRTMLSMVGWAVVFLNLVFFKSGTYYGDLNIRALMSQTDREAYLNDRLPVRNAIMLVNQLNVRRAPVAVFSSPLTAGLNADALYPGWYNYSFQEKVMAATTPDDVAQLLMEEGADYVVLDSNWGAAAIRKIIGDATDKINEQGPITVRKLKSSFQFQKELVKNADFSSYDGWMLPPNMHEHTQEHTQEHPNEHTHEQGAGRMIVSVSSPSSQLIAVTAGRRYRNSVTASCKDQPTQGRIQINWLNSKANFISTDIQVFDCTPTATTHTMEVTAPPGASQAAVYASGHTAVPLIFSEVSFKQ